MTPPVTHRLCPLTGVRIEIDTFCPRCLHVHVGAILNHKPCFIECGVDIGRVDDIANFMKAHDVAGYDRMLVEHEQDVNRALGEC